MRSPRHRRWGFRWTDAPIGYARRTRPAWIDDRTAVGQLLDEAYPDASVRQQSARVRAWAGIHDDDGRLIACAADTSEAPGLGFVAAITTRPELRGQGIGRRISGWILDRLVEREGVAALWHYGSNVAAARVYDALGMHSLPMTAGRPS